MSIAKVIEVLAEGSTVEEAVQNAVTQASRTLDGIKHVYVKDIQGMVENEKVTRYRVNVKLTFVVAGSDA
jgi:hypothetical protein